MPLSCYSRSSAGGVARCFVSAVVVGGDRDTAAQSVASLPRAKHIEKTKEDIVGQKKGRRLIGRLKTAVGWD
jgi:ADP-ribosylglycohydrolase